MPELKPIFPQAVTPWLILQKLKKKNDSAKYDRIKEGVKKDIKIWPIALALCG
jgi:hypothetical protein